MKNLIIILTGSACLFLVTTGCQPKLAESPYGAREEGWGAVIKNTYPNWEPPQTYPPDRDAVAPLAFDGPQIISEDEITIETMDEDLVIDDPVVEKDNIEHIEVEITSEFQTYTVQKGDTLWGISRKFYGTGKNWEKIFQANQDVISSPDKIKSGIDIKIPADQ